jgi:hypothetical protein
MVLPHGSERSRKPDTHQDLAILLLAGWFAAGDTYGSSGGRSATGPKLGSSRSSRQEGGWDDFPDMY